MSSIPDRVLVVSPNWIGDAIMAHPLLRLLKQHYPHVVIDVLAPSWVAPVWQAMKEVGQVYETPFKHGKLQLIERWKLGRFLKTRHYDQAYVLPNTLKFALIPWMAAIPERIGYLGECRFGLLNVIHRNDKKHPRPMIPFYAALAEAPTLHVSSDKWPKPQLTVSADEMNAVREKLALPLDRLTLAFAPGAEYGPAKRWPVSHFAELAERLEKSYARVQIVLLGSVKDREIGEEIVLKVPSVVNLAGRTTLKEAIALIAGLDVVVTNDSGLMHVASAFDIPLVALYGSTDYRHTPPFSSQSHIVSLDLDCAPCQKRECPLGHHRCMQQLLPERVEEIVERIVVENGLEWKK